MVRVTIEAGLPIPQGAAFDALVPFDDLLLVAPAVVGVDRDGAGDAGTSYSIDLARFNRSVTLETTVTALDDPHSLTWRAERPIMGQWRLEARDNGVDVTIETTVADELLDRVSLGRLLRISGIDALVSRGFRREVGPVLIELVEQADGDPRAIELTDVQIDRDIDTVPR